MAHLADPARAGLDPVRVTKRIERFRRQQADGVFPGGQLVVMRHGALGVDEATGTARSDAEICRVGTACAMSIVTNGNRAPVKLVTRCAPFGSAARTACVARTSVDQYTAPVVPHAS